MYKIFAIEILQSDAAVALPNVLLVQLTEIDVDQLRLERDAFLRVREEVENVHHLSFRNGYGTHWVDTSDEPLFELLNINAETGVASLDFQTYSRLLRTDDIARMEYELFSVDEEGVVFYGDVRHTDLTLCSRVLRWALLFPEEVQEPKQT